MHIHRGRTILIVFQWFNIATVNKFVWYNGIGWLMYSKVHHNTKPSAIESSQQVNDMRFHKIQKSAK